jgi:hypothetical protein
MFKPSKEYPLREYPLHEKFPGYANPDLFLKKTLEGKLQHAIDDLKWVCPVESDVDYIALRFSVRFYESYDFMSRIRQALKALDLLPKDKRVHDREKNGKIEQDLDIEAVTKFLADHHCPSMKDEEAIAKLKTKLSLVIGHEIHSIFLSSSNRVCLKVTASFWEKADFIAPILKKLSKELLIEGKLAEVLKDNFRVDESFNLVLNPYLLHAYCQNNNLPYPPTWTRFLPQAEIQDDQDALKPPCQADSGAAGRFLTPVKKPGFDRSSPPTQQARLSPYANTPPRLCHYEDDNFSDNDWVHVSESAPHATQQTPASHANWPPPPNRPVSSLYTSTERDEDKEL